MTRPKGPPREDGRPRGPASPAALAVGLTILAALAAILASPPPATASGAAAPSLEAAEAGPSVGLQSGSGPPSGTRDVRPDVRSDGGRDGGRGAAQDGDPGGTPSGDPSASLGGPAKRASPTAAPRAFPPSPQGGPSRAVPSFFPAFPELPAFPFRRPRPEDPDGRLLGKNPRLFADPPVAKAGPNARNPTVPEPGAGPPAPEPALPERTLPERTDPELKAGPPAQEPALPERTVPELKAGPVAPERTLPERTVPELKAGPATSVRTVPELGPAAPVRPSPSRPAPRIRPRVERIVERPPGLFTQGLMFHRGRLYESTGLYGQSAVRIWPHPDPPGGPPLAALSEPELTLGLPAALFGEGLAAHGSGLRLLTWREGVVLGLDPATLAVTDTLFSPGEGWGLTFDGSALWLSDGSDRLSPRRPSDFGPAEGAAAVSVHDGASPVTRLNELEFDPATGLILANVWGSPLVAAVDPSDGAVRYWLDLTDVAAAERRSSERPSDAVLNGLAIDERGRLWATGKLWPRLYLLSYEPPAGLARPGGLGRPAGPGAPAGPGGR